MKNENSKPELALEYGKSNRAYNHALDPLDPDNIKAAETHHWTFDPDFNLYRDRFGHLIPFEGEEQLNESDCLR